MQDLKLLVNKKHGEIEHIMEVVKALEESSLLINGAIEAIKNETQEQKERFLLCYYGH